MKNSHEFWSACRCRAVKVIRLLCIGILGWRLALCMFFYMSGKLGENVDCVR